MPDLLKTPNCRARRVLLDHTPAHPAEARIIFARRTAAAWHCKAITRAMSCREGVSAPAVRLPSPLRGSGGSALAAIAARHGATAAQITLAWLLRRSPAMLPIPGTLSLDHVKENLAALNIELSDAEFEALR